LYYFEDLKTISALTISSKKTLADALNLLNKNGRRLILVVDDDKLVGTLSDGDIRKRVLQDLKLDVRIFNIMNKDCKFLWKKSHSKLNRKTLLKYNIIPVVDAKKKIVGIYTSENLSKFRNIKKTIALIVAGGRGSRMLPLTKNIPKALLDVNGKYMIEHIIENLVNSNIERIFVSVYFQASKIVSSLGKGIKYGIKLKYIKESKPLGSAGSLYSFQKIDFDNLLLVNCDVYSDIDYDNLIEFHIRSNSDITVASKIYESQVNYGVLQVSGKKIVGIDEKPIIKLLINSGIYVISKSALPRGKQKYVDITEIIKTTIHKKGKVLSYPFNDRWLDLGSLKEYYSINDKK
jgi:dTDP-glucose pyrophosphorylase